MLHWRNCRFGQELDVFFSGDREFGLWVVNNKIISAGEHIRKLFLVPFRCQFVHCIRGTWNYDVFDLYILVPRFISCLKMRYTPPTNCHGKQWGLDLTIRLSRQTIIVAPSKINGIMGWSNPDMVGYIPYCWSHPCYIPLFCCWNPMDYPVWFDCLNQGKNPTCICICTYTYIPV
jgi:hypothetical protein